MSETVRLPDPVYERASREADRQDVPIGTIIRDWMDKAEKFDNIERGRHA